MKSRIGPFLSGAELADRRVLDDALLHLLEAEVILVEAAAHVGHARACRRVVFDQGRSAIHSRYVLVTLNSADCCAIERRRRSCFSTTFSTSGGTLARRIRSRSSSISSSSPPSPSSS